jgi:hypothetical protein
MFKGAINELELSNILFELEKNQKIYELRKEKVVQPIQHGIDNAQYYTIDIGGYNINYDIHFTIDFGDKYYRGIKNIYPTWNWNNVISYYQILKVFNLNSENSQKIYNDCFFLNISKQYQNNIDVIHDFTFMTTNLTKFKIHSDRESCIPLTEKFFRDCNQILYESIHHIKSVKDFY